MNPNLAKVGTNITCQSKLHPLRMMTLSPWAMPMISSEITSVQALVESKTLFRMMMGMHHILITMKALTFVIQYVL